MNNRPRVLLVDDDTDLLRLMELRLSANGLSVKAMENADKAIAQLSSFQPHVVVTDLKMPGMDGMAFFEWIQQHHLHLPVIILTAHGTIPDAVAATQQGVFSYLVKPFEASILLDNITKALRQSGGPTDREGDHGDSDWKEDIIYCSQMMEELLEETRAAAITDVSVLIQSETGKCPRKPAASPDSRRRDSNQPAHINH